MRLDLIQRLSIPSDSKVVLCVLDGLGGLPGPRGRTELEEAHTDHLDRLADSGALGLTIPVGHAITPGSGPGHMALFGYDPLDALVDGPVAVVVEGVAALAPEGADGRARGPHERD